MRVTFAHGMIVAATILGLTGCQSGPGGSGRSWWGAKNKPASAPAYSNAPAGPLLPSASASPAGARAGPGYANVPPGASGGSSAATAAHPDPQTTYPSTYAGANPAYGAAPAGGSLPPTQS